MFRIWHIFVVNAVNFFRCSSESSSYSLDYVFLTAYEAISSSVYIIDVMSNIPIKFYSCRLVSLICKLLHRDTKMDVWQCRSIFVFFVVCSDLAAMPTKHRVSVALEK